MVSYQQQLKVQALALDMQTLAEKYTKITPSLEVVGCLGILFWLVIFPEKLMVDFLLRYFVDDCTEI